MLVDIAVIDEQRVRRSGHRGDPIPPAASPIGIWNAQSVAGRGHDRRLAATFSGHPALIGARDKNVGAAGSSPSCRTTQATNRPMPLESCKPSAPASTEADKPWRRPWP